MQFTGRALPYLKKFTVNPFVRLFLLLIPLIIMIILSFGVPLLTGETSTPRSPVDRFTPPLGRTQSGNFALLGTDQLGRDLLLEIVHGGRISLFVSFFSVIIAMLFGTTVGMLAGYYGGLPDMLLMRVVELQLCFPPTLLAIFLSVFIGHGLTGVIIVLTAIRWAQFARVARGEVLYLKHKEFVEGARSLGASTLYIFCQHIIPHLFSTVTVLATSMLGRQMVIEASLSFLGIGVTRPAISWGGIITAGRNYLTQAWWVSTLPGLVMLITVVSISLFGDALRDYLDPKMEKGK